MENARLTPQALTVLERRYLAKNAQGQVIESPEGMFWRVARDVAEAEGLYGKQSSVDELAESFLEDDGFSGLSPQFSLSDETRVKSCNNWLPALSCRLKTPWIRFLKRSSRPP